MKKQNLFTPPKEADPIQASFDEAIVKILPEIVTDLRQKKCHLIDDKSIQNIRDQKVGFKIYNQTNSVNTYVDGQKICFQELSKNPYDGDLYLGVKPDKMQLFINPTGPIVGAEVFAIHASSLYKVRRPVMFGDLAITNTYTRTEVV